jgi:hypothetical protein
MAAELERRQALRCPAGARIEPREQPLPCRRVRRCQRESPGLVEQEQELVQRAHDEERAHHGARDRGTFAPGAPREECGHPLSGAVAVVGVTTSKPAGFERGVDATAVRRRQERAGHPRWFVEAEPRRAVEGVADAAKSIAPGAVRPQLRVSRSVHLKRALPASAMLRFDSRPQEKRNIRSPSALEVRRRARG